MIKKGKNSKKITFIFFLFFLIFLIIQFISPLFLPINTVNHLSGQTGLQDNKDNFDEMPFPINSIYSFGDYFCHQKSDRSLFINENQMPFCSRCTAIWFGIAIGLAFMVFYVINLNNKFLLVIIIGILPLAIDGIGQLVGFWESTNLIRFITGILTGLICGLAIGVIIDEIIEIKK